MIRHIVMFRLREELPKKEILSEAKKRARSLQEAIPFIRNMEVYTGAVGAPEGNYDIALICNFDSMAELEAYRDHPAHVAFRGYITPLRELRACFDYEYEEKTAES